MKKIEKVIVFILILVFVGLIGILISLKQGWFKPQKKYLYVYLLFSKTEEPKLIPVSRDDSGLRNLEEKIEFVMESLIAGPTAEERDAGLSTSLSSEAKLLNYWIRENIVFLDFSNEIEKGGGSLLMKSRLAQIVFTATQFPEIEKVRFLIDSKFIKYFSGEGITDVENPIGRDNFPGF